MGQAMGNFTNYNEHDANLCWQWAELILSKAFDAKKLLLSTTLLAIKVNMFDLV